MFSNILHLYITKSGAARVPKRISFDFFMEIVSIRRLKMTPNGFSEISFFPFVFGFIFLDSFFGCIELLNFGHKNW